MQRLEHIVQQDIPRSGPLITLTALGTLLKAQQSLKLTDDPQPAFSYLESFLAFQPGRKDETDYMNVPYLRNRAFDLNLWLTLPVLRQHGYRFEGIPAIVTRDRVLHRLILRVIPPIWRENLIMDFSLLEEGCRGLYAKESWPSAIPFRSVASRRMSSMWRVSQLSSAWRRRAVQMSVSGMHWIRCFYSGGVRVSANRSISLEPAHQRLSVTFAITLWCEKEA